MIAALLGRGAKGVPAPQPVDFATLRLPASPNTCLAAPPGFPNAHLTTPPLPTDADRAFEVIRTLPAERFPRTYLLAAWPERRQAQWVVRSALANFPDIVAAEIASGPAGTGLFLYSRSLIGWSDFGVNRKRVQDWIAAIEAAVRAGS